MDSSYEQLPNYSEVQCQYKDNPDFPLCDQIMLRHKRVPPLYTCFSCKTVRKNQASLAYRRTHKVIHNGK